MKKVVIIGAGMGGLAAALRLAYEGFDVTLLEKQNLPGGRSNIIQENGFRVDTGPTILVMKDAFDELYRSIGQNLDERLQFTRLDPNYRVYYHDGTSMDLYSNLSDLAGEAEKVQPGGAEQVSRFMKESGRKYELGMDFVDRNYDHFTDILNPWAGVRLLQTHAHQKLYSQVSRFFSGNDKLSKAFSFHSMFLGLSPYDALAMYSLITYADLALGMWYPMGGIYSIVEDMVTLCEELGVRIRVSAPVAEICVERGKVLGVILRSGEFIGADVVISNADLPYTYRYLLPTTTRKDFTDRRLERMSYACSGFILYLGIDRTYPEMRHQSLYFSEDYKANLDAIFVSKTLPEDPSFHLNNPTVTDPTLAPPGHSVLYVLAPMPNLEAQINWDMAAPAIREKLLAKLESLIDPDLRKHIVWERQCTPTDWQNDINATLGTAFGSFSQGFFQSSYFRPHNKSYEIEGLYFVGQGTYPGIGLPMVMISSKLVTKRVVSEWM